MLGSAKIYSKNSKGQRKRIDVPEKGEIDKLIKENTRKTHMIFLSNKYFNKIVNCVIKEIYKNNNNVNFYFNYYDFVNNKLGKPLGFLNEFMSEMCYDYSEYVTKDCHGNPLTFKTLFGNNFKWEILGKNKINISW